LQLPKRVPENNPHRVLPEVPLERRRVGVAKQDEEVGSGNSLFMREIRLASGHLSNKVYKGGNLGRASVNYEFIMECVCF